MSHQIELRELRLFRGVAEHGSFSLCAEHCGISQPALSRTIKLMEDRLGVRLFDRDTRTVALSSYGRHLLPIAERVLREVEAGLDSLDQLASGARGRIVVASLPSLSATVLPRAISAFRETAPDVEFELIDALSGDIAEAVIQGRADLGLALRPIKDDLFNYEEIGLDLFGLVCREDDPMAVGPRVSWRDFEMRPFIAMASNSSVRLMTDAAFVQVRSPVKPLYECSQMATVGALVLNGLGVSALPRLAMPLTAASGLVWRSLSQPSLKRSVGIITRRNQAVSPTLASFISTVIRHSDAVLGRCKAHLSQADGAGDAG